MYFVIFKTIQHVKSQNIPSIHRQDSLRNNVSSSHYNMVSCWATIYLSYIVSLGSFLPLQWDTRSGEIVQEYDRHLGAVNSITFVDQNRRFVTTSDDKSLRVWEWWVIGCSVFANWKCYFVVFLSAFLFDFVSWIHRIQHYSRSLVISKWLTFGQPELTTR